MGKGHKERKIKTWWIRNGVVGTQGRGEGEKTWGMVGSLDGDEKDIWSPW